MCGKIKILKFFFDQKRVKKICDSFDSEYAINRMFNCNIYLAGCPQTGRKCGLLKYLLDDSYSKFCVFHVNQTKNPTRSMKTMFCSRNEIHSFSRSISEYGSGFLGKRSRLHISLRSMFWINSRFFVLLSLLLIFLSFVQNWNLLLVSLWFLTPNSRCHFRSVFDGSFVLVFYVCRSSLRWERKMFQINEIVCRW